MAIQAITEAGGLPVVAHPGLVGSDEIVERLLKDGAKGLEAYYPMHSEGEISKYIELAHKYDEIVTCGSNSHGPNRKKSFPIGSMKAPIDVLTIFQTRLKEASLRIKAKLDENMCFFDSFICVSAGRSFKHC